MKTEAENLKTKNRSFSAVSTATIARVGAFFQFFRDLQDLIRFAILCTAAKSKFQKIWSTFLVIFQ